MASCSRRRRRHHHHRRRRRRRRYDRCRRPRRCDRCRHRRRRKGGGRLKWWRIRLLLNLKVPGLDPAGLHKCSSSTQLSIRLFH